MVVLWEVLEHIENDEATLKSIREKLRDDGHLLLSVPCRRSQWSIWDEFAGHLRCYEEKELHDLLSSSGYEVVSLFNGLTAWYFTMLPIGKLIAFRNRKGWEHKTKTEMTKKSGVRLLMLSPILVRPLKVILNRMLLPFFLVLEATFAHNLSYGGYSYQVLARKLR
jgi:2-polyprenyl-3-methyl-5-hydroxy-6-metoxy-1,4-benzoquinol methylase